VSTIAPTKVDDDDDDDNNDDKAVWSILLSHDNPGGE